MPIYPKAINEAAAHPMNAGRLASPFAAGRAVNFECGCLIAFELAVTDLSVDDIKFRTTGCGYMTAAADVLSSTLKGKAIADIHLFRDDELEFAIRSLPCPPERRSCIDAVMAAIRESFAEVRENRVRQFAGDSPLICSCFGVDEATIEESLRAGGAHSIEDVTFETRAGAGCGSCRMLIQELIDTETAMGDML